MTVLTAPTAVSLAERHRALLSAEPRLRARDAAARLGVSEAELLDATGGGIRLEPRWEELVRACEKLGRVMVLARNDWAVIEKEGPVGNVRFFGAVGQVVGDEIDLRLFTGSWASAFASTVETPKGDRRSLQVFDAQGTAVVKIYLLAESSVEGYDALVEALRAADGAPLSVDPPKAPREEQPDAAVDRAGLLAGWRGLTDTHDFFRLLARFGVTRTQALRLAEADLARPVKVENLRTTLEWAVAGGHEIMVFVGNPGIVGIHTGPVQRIADTPGWLNVLDPGFNLHVRTAGLASAWAVTKPTSDGPVHSLEIYDAAGGTVVQLFGKRKPGRPELPAWTEHVAGLS